jgi:hypothetical protein
MVDLYCNERITTKADMWAMGCLLYKLCFFEDAFGDSSLSILSGKLRIPEGHHFTPDLLELIRKFPHSPLILSIHLFRHTRTLCYSCTIPLSEADE